MVKTNDTLDSKTIIEPETIVIPAGGFMMGCDAGADNERPVHRVAIDRFAIGRFQSRIGSTESFWTRRARTRRAGTIRDSRILISRLRM